VPVPVTAPAWRVAGRGPVPAVAQTRKAPGRGPAPLGAQTRTAATFPPMVSSGLGRTAVCGPGRPWPYWPGGRDLDTCLGVIPLDSRPGRHAGHSLAQRRQDPRHGVCSPLPLPSRHVHPGPVRRHGRDAGPGPVHPAQRQHDGGEREEAAGQPAHHRLVRARAIPGPGGATSVRAGACPGMVPRHECGGNRRREALFDRREGQQAVDLCLRNPLRQVAGASEAGSRVAEQALRQRGRHDSVPVGQDACPGRAVAAVLAGHDLGGHRPPEVDPGRAEQFRDLARGNADGLRHTRGAQALPGGQRQRLPLRPRQAHHRAQGHSRRALWAKRGNGSPGLPAQAPDPGQR